MRIVVLGIDALDYDYVVMCGFEEFMLRNYGKLRIPEELWLNGVPYTPLVWTAYLTGRRPAEVGVESIYQFPKWLRLIQKIIAWTPLRFVKGKRRVLRKFGFEVTKPYKIRGNTLLDDVKSVGINVPGVSLDKRFYKILDLIDRGEFFAAVRLSYGLTRDVFVKVREAVEVGWADLIFGYVNLLDIVGHLFWVKEPKEVVMAYKFVSSWVEVLRKLAITSGYHVIIISDHGMRDSGDGVTGTHTEFGFWASTLRDFSLSSPYEFREKVVRLVRAEAD